MKQILLFGAGKSSSALIDYILKNAEEELWKLTVIDADFQLAKNKIGDSPFGMAATFDVNDSHQRSSLIRTADLVISLLPPHLHIQIAKDCLQLRKNLLTASYINNELRSLSQEIKAAGILFLCEMGLDPGIDHMSAKKIIDTIRSNDGMITSFMSHCGGLVAPESDDNPWHYKISWNPKNVVNAGKDGAIFKQDGKIVKLNYHEVFGEKRYLALGEELFCWYPNRDSLNYAQVYGLENCHTFIRTTLRHPDFIYGWQNLIDLKLTDETVYLETGHKTVHQVFQEHLDKNNFKNWLEQKLHDQFDITKSLLSNLVNLTQMEQQSSKQGIEPAENFMMVTEKGSLQNVDLEDLKNDAAATIAFKLHESKLTLSQLFYLGMDDNKTMVNKGHCSAANFLQFLLENKLALKDQDKDRVVMLHEIEYLIADTPFKIRSSLSINGQNKDHTAMAKTVGLPLGIAAKLILKGEINLKGLQIPVKKEIYEPVLKELKDLGIEFTEETIPL
ncbi:saccharopine dehydrogenase NADP-binding domain-containing protein [Chitinophagaceae bacterium LB-8]|uniref:Saccharopine dehydrogenase NADP-binding domain-containing protein n=1 Tax=Paraflavisolibacter caeni TaxID=2982496 RepID=A0A9X2XTY4_9BACT|nr:saccharopine dehydrogenase C-terminal domain-containing protein [Paraflavisolibacter caeni]MCU7549184.1 saccharopine dehydrogenase NADP-binding domain-containing protein [Paraflavisolibacter caeni]